jgi:hypothetical protein
VGWIFDLCGVLGGWMGGCWVLFDGLGERGTARLGRALLGFGVVFGVV